MRIVIRITIKGRVFFFKGGSTLPQIDLTRIVAIIDAPTLGCNGNCLRSFVAKVSILGMALRRVVAHVSEG